MRRRVHTLTLNKNFYTFNIQFIFLPNYMKRKIIASLIIVGFLVSGCSVFKKSPQAAVEDGMAKLADVKKASSTLTMSGTITMPEAASPLQFTVNAVSKSDSSDMDNPKTDSTFKITAAADGNTVNGDFMLRVLEKKFYVNLVNVDVSGDTGAAMKTQLKDIFNTWWFFPVENGQNPADDLKAKQKELLEKFKNAKFFTNAKEEGKEEVGGVSATRYTVELDKAAVKDFLIEVLDSLGNAQGKMTAEEKTQVEENLKNVEFSGAVWVGDDEVIHRIKGTFTFRPKEAGAPSASIDVDYTGSDYGKDVAITAPENPKEFQPSALIPLLGAFGSLDTVPGPTDTPVTPTTPAPATTTPKK